MFLYKIKIYIIKKIIIIKQWFYFRNMLKGKLSLSEKNEKAIKKLILKSNKKNNDWLSKQNINLKYEKDENGNTIGVIANIEMPQFIDFEIKIKGEEK